MPELIPEYRAPSWCPGAHLQTVLPAKMCSRPGVNYRAERVTLSDGDFMIWHWAQPEPADPKAPVLVHFHGLEGSSGSHYARALMHACVKRGWRGVVAHFRSCGGALNDLPRAYYAGDTADNSFVLKTVHARFPDAKLYAVGVSLGGNQLAKCLGDLGDDLSFVEAAVSVGAPLDLVAGSERISKGVNVLYADMFLSTLKPKLEAKIKRWPELMTPEELAACKTMYDFDNTYTAPVHGFKSAMDYWMRCSAKRVLGGVTRPLLLLNAKNDPFLPGWCLPSADEVSKDVYLDFPEEGGHIGFPTGSFPGRIDWLPNRIMRFFDTGG